MSADAHKVGPRPVAIQAMRSNTPEPTGIWVEGAVGAAEHAPLARLAYAPCQQVIMLPYAGWPPVPKRATDER